MPNQTIPVSTANLMIQQYQTYMTSYGIDVSKQTQNVGFTTPALVNWMSQVSTYTDEYRICLGVYPPGHPKAGHITTIIWPYKDGHPAVRPDQGKGSGGGTFFDPYNEGDLHP